MGELLGRYWQPVCTSDELHDLPKKVKLLCEEVVVFRDKKGRVRALEPHCSHRGTSLEWGRVEEEGLRCCYHGWLYDTQGQRIDMPCETEEFRRRMDVWHPTEPLFPMYDIIDTRHRDDGLCGYSRRFPNLHIFVPILELLLQEGVESKYTQPKSVERAVECGAHG